MESSSVRHVTGTDAYGRPLAFGRDYFPEKSKEEVLETKGQNGQIQLKDEDPSTNFIGNGKKPKPSGFGK
jgi:hypothetical protein